MTDAERCRTPACRTRPEPGYAPRGLCGWCEARGVDAVNLAYRDWLDLQPLIWDKLAGGIGATGGEFGPTEPINLAADTLAREIAYTAVLWEIPVREAADLSDAPNQHDQPGGGDTARASTILTAHYPVLINLRRHDHVAYDRRPTTADGVDAIIAMTRLHQQARSMLAITDKQTTVPGMCSVCNTETLRHKDGSNDVFCVTCKATWTWDEHQDAVAVVPVPRSAA